jgi:hypothetical protein
MSFITRRRSLVVAAGVAAALAAAALPASALTLGIGGSSLLHVQDCRSVALTRQAAYDLGFSSTATGPIEVKTGVLADGSLTLCYNLYVNSLTAVQVTTWTNVTANTLVASLLGEADASRVCTAIDLHLWPGVTGTVSASASADVVVDGLPPFHWDDTFAKDTQVNGIGQDITLKGCYDTNGNATLS